MSQEEEAFTFFSLNRGRKWSKTLTKVFVSGGKHPLAYIE